jgi:hypothetical protein
MEWINGDEGIVPNDLVAINAAGRLPKVGDFTPATSSQNWSRASTPVRADNFFAGLRGGAPSSCVSVRRRPVYLTPNLAGSSFA